MPASQSKAQNETKANGASKRKTASTSGTATPVAAAIEKDVTTISVGKPDKKPYDADQARIKLEIDTVQAKLNAIRDKIAIATKSGPGNDHKNALKAELNSIRDQQSLNKNSKEKNMEQIKIIQDNIHNKIKDLQAAKSKIPFKNVDEVDAHIKTLENQVESGSMKLADEKRALQEISSSKKSRRIVEAFQANQESIDADRQKIEQLRIDAENPANRAISDRYDAIKAELDELKKQADEAYAGRSKLFEERDAATIQLNGLFEEKRQSVQRYREANDLYWKKVNEDRARRAEKAEAQRVAEENQKKKEMAERLLEEAQIPAYQAQIEDCQTLIDHFTGKSSGNLVYKSTNLIEKIEVAGVPKLDIRKVEEAPEGLVARKKKGEEEDAYFVASKGKAKKSTIHSNKITSPPPAPASLNVPLTTLSALLSLSIPPPASNGDVPRVIEDLHTKRAWFEANQPRVTAETIAKAEAEVLRLTKGDGHTQIIEESSSEIPTGTSSVAETNGLSNEKTAADPQEFQ